MLYVTMSQGFFLYNRIAIPMSNRKNYQSGLHDFSSAQDMDTAQSGCGLDHRSSTTAVTTAIPANHCVNTELDILLAEQQALTQATRKGETYPSGTSGGGNNVACCSTATTPVLHRGSINSLLCCGGGMNGGHQTRDNTKLVIEDL